MDPYASKQILQVFIVESTTKMIITTQSMEMNKWHHQHAIFILFTRKYFQKFNYLLTYHIVMELFLDFWRESLTPLVQEGYLGSTWPESAVDKIVGADPAKIEAPGTPGLSLGTKIFDSKFYSCHAVLMLFYGFCKFVLQKMMKNKKYMTFPSK